MQISSNQIFWQTLFFPDINDTNNFVIISYHDQIIEDSDMQQGFVTKEQFLEITSDLNVNITDNSIGEHSFLVEYEVNKGDNLNSVETKRIPIREGDSSLHP